MYILGMATNRKSGAGRKPLPKHKVKLQVSFRAPPDVIDALQRAADKSDRKASQEALHAVKRYLREIGEYAGE